LIAETVMPAVKCCCQQKSQKHAVRKGAGSQVCRSTEEPMLKDSLAVDCYKTDASRLYAAASRGHRNDNLPTLSTLMYQPLQVEAFERTVRGFRSPRHVDKMCDLQYVDLL
jgi:hypothetical protein